MPEDALQNFDTLTFCRFCKIIVSMEQDEISENERKALLDDGLREMCNLIAKNNDPQTIYDFFGCLFTPAEMRDFATRWLLVKEIDKGTTQREIARKFGMSLCKITRGSRELKKQNSAFRRFLELAKKL